MESREYMITNRNLNSMFKPNNINGKFSFSSGMNNDGGIKIIDGKFNHQTAILFDIIYDQIYRMFNQLSGTDYIGGLMSLLSSNDDLRKTYFTTLLTDKKLDFYLKIGYLLVYAEKVKSIPYDKHIRNYLLSVPEITNEAFDMEFIIQYNHALEKRCEEDGNFDRLIEILINFKFEKRFFLYLFEKMFYGRVPSWKNFSLDINLNSIFQNNERSIYVLKNWFEGAKNLTMSISYPITCFSDCFDSSKPYVPKKLFLKTFMMAINDVQPFHGVKYNKGNMTVSISLLNKFMAFFSHDAKLCVRSFIPSSLYTLTSNPFFIGKNILNNTYYDRKEKKYKNKLNYSVDEIFEYLNLGGKDFSNSSHKKKSIFKALEQLNDLDIIHIEKLTQERLNLSGVWNINDGFPCEFSNDELKDEF